MKLARHAVAVMGLALGGVGLAAAQQPAPGSAVAPPAMPPQAATAASGAAGGPQRAQGHGFAEALRPTTRRARPAAAAGPDNRPYAPISKPDDEGQIPEIEMFVGESRVFPTPGVARIAVGNGAILTAAALDSKEVILFANAPGTSSLFIWNADGRYQRLKISIVPGDASRHAREIAAFLSTIPKARATVVGSNVILEGDDLSDADQGKLDELAKRYPQIVNFTNRVGWEQMVTLDVKVVEFPVNLLREMGLKWTSTGGAAIAGIWAPASRGDSGPYQVNIFTGSGNPVPITGPGGTPAVIPRGLNSIAFLNMGLNAQLSLLQQEGQASVLAEPQLTARNGATANFVAGGELPYGVTTIDGTRITFKEYGIKLDVTPQVSNSGVIRASITAEVSSIDASISTAFGPGLLTRKTKTEFNVRDGETMVLSGLLQRDLNNTVDKVPVLGDIPVLGALFRSKRYQNKETELVVFVTPTLVDARSPMQVDRVRRATERLEKNLDKPPFLSNPLQPGVSYERPQVIPVPAAAPPAVAAPVAEPAASAAGHEQLLAHVAGGSRLLVTADATALRAHPTQHSAMLMQLHRGATVRLGDADPQPSGSGAWRNVVVGAVNGWVPASAVRPTSDNVRVVPPVTAQQAQHGRPAVAALAPAAGSPVPPAAAGAEAAYRVTLPGLALRVTPDINAPLLANLRAGTVVHVLPDAARGAWTAVRLGEGEGQRRGWVASQWLQPVSPGASR